MTEQTLKAKFEIKELELNALLEITQAINNNLPEESLYKIYNFHARSNLNIRKLALYVLDADWNCKVCFGTKKPFFKSKLLPEFKTIQDITHLSDFTNVNSRVRHHHSGDAQEHNTGFSIRRRT